MRTALAGWALPALAVVPAVSWPSAAAARDGRPARVVRAKFAAVARHSPEEIATFYAPEAVLIASDLCQPRQGTAEVERTYRAIFAALPDVRAEVTDLVSQGDRVAAKVALRGTFSGRPFALDLMDFFTVRRGKIVRDEGMFDNGGRPCRP